MTDPKKLPEGRLGRLARLAGAGLRVGASALGDSDGASAAKHAAEVFGTLRGLAAKVGQMASYVDGVVPEGQRAAYETAMKGLRAAAPTSSPVEIRRLVEEELGAPVDRLFLRWDEAPIASASIGQVHRAAIAPESGDEPIEVAVKVQHPGIVKALDADLANAGILQMVVGSVVGKRFKTKEQLEQVRQRFREELDYRLEAERLESFHRFHRGDRTIVMPRVHAHRSSTRVLTTDFMHGASFDDACAAPDRERRAWAETLWRFVYKAILVHRHFNADPHPGNYLFRDGSVVFLDFGCVQPVPDHNIRWARVMHRAAHQRDVQAFANGFMQLLQAKPGLLAKTAVAYTRRCFEPLFHRPYRITRPYAASLVELAKEMALEARRADDSEFFAMPEDMVFMNRLQFGFYSVLARLDVEADYASVERGFWPETEAHPV
ncbi:MAG: AarF/ABC1/UbiB kinase family protein [Deltaproteobacteria bacterium]|nr:AarF/ABC1/UbiB kinase family protein [Deltaproteobacteria bacterium]